MTAIIEIERGETHETVDACFCTQIAVGILTGDQDGRAFDTGFFAGQQFNGFGFVVTRFAPAKMHPHQHGCPVLGFGAACAGVNAQDCIVRIVLATEHQLKFDPLNLRRDFFQIRLDLFAYGLVIFLDCESKQQLEVFELGVELSMFFYVFPQVRDPLCDFLGTLGIVPKVRLCGFFLKCFELFFLIC